MRWPGRQRGSGRQRGGRREAEVRARPPTLAALADLRLALGLLSGDPLCLPDPLGLREARRVLDALVLDALGADGASLRFATEGALVQTATAVFAAFTATVAQAETEADVSVQDVADACLVDLGSGDAESSGLERGLASGFGPADYAALHAMPLHAALIYLGHRGVQRALDAEEDHP